MIALRLATERQPWLEVLPEISSARTGDRWAYFRASEVVRGFSSLELRDGPAGDASSVTVGVPVVSLDRPVAGSRLLLAAHRGDLYVATRPGLLASLGLLLREDAEALSEHLAYGCVAPPRTPFLGVRLCARGARVVANKVTSWRFVESPLPEESLKGERQTTSQVVLSALSASLKRLPSDSVALLSGGLDSTVLTALMSSRSRPAHTYSTSYWFDRDGSEQAYAESAARFLGTRHLHVVPDGGAFRAAVIRAIKASEEPLPFVQCALLDAAMAELELPAGQVLVNGQGADAAFPIVPAEAQAPVRLDALAHRLASTSDPSLAVAAAALGIRKERLSASRVQLVERIAAAAPTPYDVVRRYRLAVTVDGAQQSWSASARRLGLRMAFPFLDRPVLAAAAAVQLPEAALEPKRTLREAARGLGLDERLIVRPKNAFGPASRRWAGELSPLLSVCCEGHVRTTARELETQKHGRYVLWNLVNQDLWRRLVLCGQRDNDIIAELSEGGSCAAGQ